MPPGHDPSALTAGFALGGTYLLSIGPNKMTIIREAIVRGRIGFVASAILRAYLTLLGLSSLCADRLLAHGPAVRTTLSWLGVVAMGWFAVRAIRSAFGDTRRAMGIASTRETLGACVRRIAGTAAANPLMYLEFFFIPSAVAGSFASAGLRLQFTCGLAIMAAVTCYGYAIGAHACTRLLRHQRTLQAFDLICGLLLASMASSLAFRLLSHPM